MTRWVGLRYTREEAVSPLLVGIGFRPFCGSAPCLGDGFVPHIDVLVGYVGGVFD